MVAYGSEEIFSFMVGEQQKTTTTLTDTLAVRPATG